MNDVASWAWLEGRVMPLAEATVALSSPGFLLGDGVFETLRARHGRIFRPEWHWERMAHGLEVLGIDPAVLETVETAVHEVCDAAASLLDDIYLRVQVVRELNHDGPARGRVSTIARPCPTYPPHWYRDGVSLGVADLRSDPHAPLSGVKSLSYLPHTLARRRAQGRGFDEALILNTEGRVCESAYGNVIARIDHVLYSPGREEGALDGVTRRVLLDWAQSQGYAIETRLPWMVLAEAEEVVLVSTLAGVVPVAAIEHLPQTHFAGAKGKLFSALRAAYEKLLNE